MRAQIVLLVMAFPLLAAPVPKSLKVTPVGERLIGEWEKHTDDPDQRRIRVQLSPGGVCSFTECMRTTGTLCSNAEGKYSLIAAGRTNPYPVIDLQLAAYTTVGGEWSLLEFDDEKLRLGHPTDGTEIEFRRVKEDKKNK